MYRYALDERVVMAYVYLDKRHELYGDWDYDQFRAQHLDQYVAMCEEFREDVWENDLPGDDEEEVGGESEEEEEGEEEYPKNVKHT